MLEHKKRTILPMVVSGVILLLFIVLAFRYYLGEEGAPAAAAASDAPIRHVLFISSYSESFVTVDRQKEGIAAAFAGTGVELDIEYMDTKQYSSAESLDLFYRQLAYKIQNHVKYDAVLLGDDAALTFAEEHQKELFDGIPLVFFCVNDTEHAAKAGENPMITGAVEQFYLKDTLDAALRLQPGADKVIGIYDDTQTGQGDRKQFWALASSYPGLAFEGIDFSANTSDQLKARLAQIDKKSVVVFLTGFLDSDGNRYTISQGAKLISDNCPVPVYRTSVGGVGEGLIGGRMVSYEDSGRQAAEMVLSILNGTPVKDIPVETEGAGDYVFDAKVLRRFGIPVSSLPAGARLVNASPDFLTAHRRELMLTMLLLFAASCAVCAWLFARQKSAEHDRRALDKILGNLPVGVGLSVIRGGETVSRTGSPRLGQLLGIGASPVTPEDFLIGVSRVHPDDLPAVRAAWDKLTTPGTEVHYVFRYDPDDSGRCRWYSADTHSVRDPDGTLGYYSALSDVTAEKTAEAEKDRNRRMYETAAELADLCVWNYDIAAHRVTISDSPATRRLRGQFNIPQVLENVPECEKRWIADEDFEEYCRMYRRLEEGQSPVSCEYWYKGGPAPRCERVTYTAVFDESGAPVCAYGIGQDITSRRLEEQNYRRWYRQLAETNPDCLCSFRLNLTTNWCGDGQSKHAHLLDLQKSGTADGLISRVAREIVDEQIREEFLVRFRREQLLEEFAAGHTDLTLDYPVRGARGGVRWLRGFFHMVLNPVTEDIEAVTNAINITTRKKNEELIARMAQESYDYIGVVDVPQRSLELQNGLWEDAKGPRRRWVDYDAFLERLAGDYVEPAERKAFLESVSTEHLEQRLREHGDYICTYSFLDGQGGTLKKQLQFAWLDDTRQELMMVQTDITEAYRLEQERMKQLREALQRAEEASRAKSEFVSRISHDIRTPISAITSMTEFALEDMDDREKLRGDLEKLRSSNTFLLSLINDILDISKIDSGQIELHFEPYPHDECVANLLDMFTPVCREKGIKLEISSTGDELVPMTDRIRINQIMLNLVSNAVKYTPAGGTVSIVTDSRRDGSGRLDCRITVRDTGIGMSDSFQRIMFEPFTQDEDNPERVKLAGGTGLGLSIVKRLVELLGGAVEVSSALGAGTAVTLRLRFDEASPEKLREYRAQAAGKRTSRQESLGGRALLVEDNRINAEIARRLLDNLGVESVRAENGQEAVDVFAASAPGEFRWVLMDLRMPVMDGYAATHAIRALPRADARTVPIIALTADAVTEETWERTSEMSGYLTKPIDRALLAQTLRELG